MKKILLILLLGSLNQAFAQNEQSLNVFPDSANTYQKQSDSETTLQLVLYDKQKINAMNLNSQDLIHDANDLTNKITKFFQSKPLSEKKKTKKSSKKTKDSVNNTGYLLITKYIFLGKDKPYTLIENEENEELRKQVYKESQCKEGICTSHIIMGINYFDNNYQIKPLDVKNFSKIVESKDDHYIRGDYNLSQEGIVKIYYFYGINGTHLPKNKEIIKNMIILSKK